MQWSALCRSRRELSKQIAIPTSIYLQKSASIQPRTSPSKLGENIQYYSIVSSIHLQEGAELLEVLGGGRGQAAVRAGLDVRDDRTWVENEESSPNTNTGYQPNLKSCPNIDIPRISNHINLSGIWRKLSRNYGLIWNFSKVREILSKFHQNLLKKLRNWMKLVKICNFLRNLQQKIWRNFANKF